MKRELQNATLCGSALRQPSTIGATTCTQLAGWGTSHPGFGHCKLHGGGSPSGDKHAARQHVNALADNVRMGDDLPEATAWSVLEEEIRRSVKVVRWLDWLVSALTSDEWKQLTWAAGKTWEKPSVWIELFEHERAHLARVSADAIKAGVQERAITLAEQAADELVSMLTTFAELLGADPRSDVVIDAVSKVLTPSAPLAVSA